jgi:hypothetical protein
MLFEPLVDAGIRLYDAGVSAGPVLPSPDGNPQDFFAHVFAAFNDRNWRYLAALTVIGVVYVVRRSLAAKITALQHGRWAWTLAVAGTAVTALAAHLASQRPVGGVTGIASALLSGAFVGLAGAGVVKGAYEWRKPEQPATDTATSLPLKPPPDDYTKIADNIVPSSMATPVTSQPAALSPPPPGPHKTPPKLPKK